VDREIAQTCQQQYVVSSLHEQSSARQDSDDQQSSIDNFEFQENLIDDCDNVQNDIYRSVLVQLIQETLT
jgi:hypothetical protein